MHKLVAVIKIFQFCLLSQVLADDSRPFQKPPYVSTEHGIVKGHVVKGEDYSYMAFLGIPYAAPPIGHNRFKAPAPITPWSGILEANRTVQCPQSGAGEEDCLVINVFTPMPHKRHRHYRRSLPVLVFIHGGAFYTGSGPTSGVEYLLKRNIIVVTFNYRIGALGFLCLGTDEAPGNAGMKDQVAAFRWVQRNIDNFGGHPKSVTIYGTSAGGASVELQILSWMSNGLFRSAIAESGSATSSWAIQVNPIETATKLAETLDFIPKDIEDLATFYQNVPADALSKANAQYHNSLTDGSVGFAPCIESTVQCTKSFCSPFLSESPYDILTHGKYDAVPMILVYSTLEGLFLKSSQYHEQNYKERMEANFEYFLPADLVFEAEFEKIAIAYQIKKFYFGNNTIGDDTIVEYLEYFGDFLILHGILNSAEFHAARVPVYLMEFFYRGGMGEYVTFYNNIKVAGHSAMSRHAFTTAPITNYSDMKAVEQVAELITNFVKHGNPTPRPSPLLPVLWPRVGEPQRMNYFFFSEVYTKVAKKPHWRRKEFWDSVYKLYRRQLTHVEPL